MKLYPIKTGVIESDADLVDALLKSLKNQNLTLENNDVIALTSKVIALVEGRVVMLSDVKPSRKAKQLSEKYSLGPEFAELILHEADKIYGGVQRAVLTLKNGVLTANAGIDNKNAPVGAAILWPASPEKSARQIRDEIKRRAGKEVAVMIVDSGLTPLRIGTTGLALAVAGFKPIGDQRGGKDLYGKPVVITRHAVADNLASAAHLLMGETTEKTPIVLIRDAPVEFDDGVYGSKDMMMPFKECLFMGTFGLR